MFSTTAPPRLQTQETEAFRRRDPDADSRSMTRAERRRLSVQIQYVLYRVKSNEVVWSDLPLPTCL
jgi:hypothetical protein